MKNFDYKKAIMDLYKDPLYQSLNAYYQQTTVFNILHSERSENRYSAFLCWLFDPKQSHGLKELPLRRLLTLYAYKYAASECSNALLVGNYEIQSVDECTTEKVVGDITNGKELRRIDIWMNVSIAVGEEKFVVPVIIENKVYALENGDQTKAYHEAMETFRQRKNLSGEKCLPIEIYLAPEGAAKPSATSFVLVTYQELLDYVIEPVLESCTDERSKLVIGDFVKNLAIPSNAQDSDNNTGNAIKTLSNSILAVSDKERNNLGTLYGNHKELFDLVIAVNGGDKAFELFPQYADGVDAEMQEALEGLWNSNFNLIVILMYICRSAILPGKENDLLKVFAASRRDNTKYLIEQRDATSGNWCVSAKFPKPMSKGMTVAAFFTLWGENRGHMSIDYFRRVFPSSLSAYYSRFTKSNKWGNSVIWEVCGDEEKNENGHLVKITDKVKAENGFEVKIADAKWDFYQDWETGYCGKAAIVKMWRKDDFDRFLEYIKHPVELPHATPDGGTVFHMDDVFADIRIVEA